MTSLPRFAAVDGHFDALVDNGRLSGYSVLVERSGVMVHEHHHGVADAATGRAWGPDTIARIYSMTKPLTSAAAMQLVEQGRLRLDDEVASYIPSFGSLTVKTDGPAVSAERPMLIRHLLTHTSGLTYEMYRPKGDSLAAVCDEWAAVPLAFEPGDGFWYGVSTDVLGRVVEVVAGQQLDEYFDQHLIGPLGMVDTSFVVPAGKLDRVASLYTPNEGDGTAVPATFDTNPPEGRRYLSGGGGLWGTGRDYVRWCRAMLNGGELDGQRILAVDSVAAMTTNQLPGRADIYSLVRDPNWGDEVRYRGFGYGFAIELGAPSAVAGSRPPTGTYDWGGAASTVFWCDPVNDEAVVFMTQLFPDAVPIRAHLAGLLRSSDPEPG